MYLVAAHHLIAPGKRLRDDAALWRRVRRYPLSVQAALAAAEAVRPALVEPAAAALISLAPCVGGSAELQAWVEQIGAKAQTGTLAELRVNPTHTLHAVDNLALSDLALALGNHGYGLGLGGAPGQAWAALELVLERRDPEALVLAGDHGDNAPYVLDTAQGVAWALAREPRAFSWDCLRGGAPAQGEPDAERQFELVAVEREDAPGTPHPSASWGLGLALSALLEAPPGPFSYRVPASDADGLDAITLRWEVA
ncbi:MAG: hypothetical protein R3F62_13735 [Planctomycetota bacterium]